MFDDMATSWNKNLVVWEEPLKFLKSPLCFQCHVDTGRLNAFGRAAPCERMNVEWVGERAAGVLHREQSSQWSSRSQGLGGEGLALGI